ncbi:hypothetical protein NOS3756_18920 [Nostoc sp. NIES-3756]|jgi:hypothetical protein|uniref:hypothetical protein n=1 Tax=Nostoc sp. NIES-3756 TaxID=1751286 RepID=UPI000720318C|nr:hypothetical protein [Nostoc sp. NIES-3756]BAT52950.1 hypothetical protein NOS3756_18920 [Nostoc sp. NIES-3756]BAY39329.1 hypothetical protein NIES2111_37050 [Nostoc sp. NIES-2111]
MLQITDLENKKLFSAISTEESTTISGGGPQSAALASIIAIGSGIFNNAIVQAAIFAIALNPTIP